MALLENAVERLQNGDVVAMPTETVYGLAARIDSKIGIEKIFSTKKRPFFDPLIVHVSSKQMAYPLTTDWSPMVDFLAEHFWPGPLTLVLPKTDRVGSMITSGLETVGIRMPKHSIALSLIEKVGVPLAAPSANRFGRTSPSTAAHVRSEFPDENILILDGGPCDVGVESTVLLVRRENEHYELSILRTGHVTQSDLEKSLRKRFSFSFRNTVSRRESPGQMRHHYMPEIPLVLVSDLRLSEKEILEKSQKLIVELPDQVEGVQIRKPQQFANLKELQLPANPVLASRLLYSELRSAAESSGVDLIYFRIEDFHSQEQWAAVLDRLTKAASLNFTEKT